MRSNTLIMFLALFTIFALVACTPQPQAADDSELLDEIAEIERQLELQRNGEEEEDHMGDAMEKDGEVMEKKDPVVNLNDGSELQQLIYNETDLVRLDVNIDDRDDDQVRLSFSPPLDQNGQWQTTFGDNGAYLVTITADDGVTQNTREIEIVVNKKNVAPVIAGLEDIVTQEGSELSLIAQITDANADDLDIDYPAPFDENGIWQTTFDDAGSYELTLSVSDEEFTTTGTFVVDVSDVNQPPIIENVPESIQILEGETVRLDVLVEDLDDDPVQLSISDPIGDDAEWEIGFTEHGNYSVIVSANDGKDTTRKEINLEVLDQNFPVQIVSIVKG